jgi:hypothetical protein
MSRQSKQRKQAAAHKAGKGHNAGLDKLAANAPKGARFPGNQPAPSWIKPTGAKGWFNAPKEKPKTQNRRGKKGSEVEV